MSARFAGLPTAPCDKLRGLAPVAQLDRVLGYEPRGRGFESCRARHSVKRGVDRKISPLCFSLGATSVLPGGAGAGAEGRGNAAPRRGQCGLAAGHRRRPRQAGRHHHRRRAPVRRGNVPEDAAGQVLRVAQRFGLVAVAGELATHYGVTGWPEGESTGRRPAKAFRYGKARCCREPRDHLRVCRALRPAATMPRRVAAPRRRKPPTGTTGRRIPRTRGFASRSRLSAARCPAAGRSA
jgi:hypothetical protein